MGVGTCMGAHLWCLAFVPFVEDHADALAQPAEAVLSALAHAGRGIVKGDTPEQFAQGKPQENAPGIRQVVFREFSRARQDPLHQSSQWQQHGGTHGVQEEGGRGRRVPALSSDALFRVEVAVWFSHPSLVLCTLHMSNRAQSKRSYTCRSQAPNALYPMGCCSPGLD